MLLLLEATKAENAIKTAQLNEYVYTLGTTEAEHYNRGFEAGKTQAGVAFMNKEALYNYRDGYHAAIEQFGVEVKTPADMILKQQTEQPPFPGTKGFEERISRGD